jgi:hypothetical protein
MSQMHRQAHTGEDPTLIVFHLAYGAGLGNRVALRAYVAPAHDDRREDRR